MKNWKTKVAIGTVAVAALLPLLGLAQVTGVVTPPSPPVTSAQDIINVLNTLINWVFTLLLILATFFIFYAAYLYLTAAGDAEKVKTASNQIIYAAVAIAVALVAQGVRFVVEQLLG
ncbi:MAG: hypothetical protein A2745_03035 [Candidatus Harrisonbacteria bacterium RIFCSPHIGHO2_01_FULL_44_13]|uniref:Uncharacterized protein n=1 Tax=Candidatus Harrisonbacteria bacterium RIFCSPLOWO2_01_FULL_44_18 TaxID=1798407 RepID=A0A1G1ZNL3_9BACT|nr:MAG: hypothetical protein A2745_03035 [Candidatus Harrisonbacteria bacterium RIFCSPHIGHO2_01_FULL_44_13]OGY65756.1 MAG: hypothetical protein A3A16_04060 [Candidatus Harrisonbacteria bacterium RIFCSPLOWO2_01_FULL_44_18]